MDYDKIREEILERVKVIRGDLDYIYTYTVNTSTEVPIAVGGNEREFSVDISTDIDVKMEEIGDETIPDALSEIETFLDSFVAPSTPPPIAEMDSGEILEALKERLNLELNEEIEDSSGFSTWPQEYVDSLLSVAHLAPVVATALVGATATPAPAAPAVDTRAPWPNLAGDRSTAPEYPAMYQPPFGYDWTGEHRPPGVGETFISNEGRALKANVTPPAGRRPILRKLEPGEIPTFGLTSRKPWPGSEAARLADTTREEFASEYEPPTGYEYEIFHARREGETFLNRWGKVETASANGTNIRHALRALPGTTPPALGSPIGIPPAEPSPTTPPEPTFEPPKTPEPV